jgi:hypothetical protein
MLKSAKGLFSHDTLLVIAGQLYASSCFDNDTASLPTDFTCLAETYDESVKFANDVRARD